MNIGIYWDINDISIDSTKQMDVNHVGFCKCFFLVSGSGPIGALRTSEGCTLYLDG